MYAMNILGYNHFTDDDDALRIFELYDPVRNKHFPKKLINFGYFELKKTNVETENQRQWQNYLLNRPLSNDAPQYIKDALKIIDSANMEKEEFELMTQLEYAESRYQNQLLYAKDERAEEIALEMLREGDAVDRVARLTKLPLEIILRLHQQLVHD
jgi:hypothetical protein